VTHEEVSARRTKLGGQRMSQGRRALPQRKFFYLFTCEYCFSHYVAAPTLRARHFRLPSSGRRGDRLAWFSRVWAQTCPGVASAGCG